MRAGDVTDTLQIALIASGCAAARVAHSGETLAAEMWERYLRGVP